MWLLASLRHGMRGGVLLTFARDKGCSAKPKASRWWQPVLPAMAEKSEAFLQCSLDWTALDTPLVTHELAPFEPLLQRVDADVVAAMVEASKSGA